MLRLGRVHLDGFIVVLLGTIVVASLVPAQGTAVPVVGAVTTVAIGVLFFLYGARIAPREALAGLTHWRLHLVILGFTFVVFPLLGLALAPLDGTVLQAGLYTGVLFLTLVPSTVQSSIAFTAMSGGNVAAAMVSASASNLLGIVLTPLLVLALMTTSGSVPVGGGAVLDICMQLLLPFVAGQLARPLIGRWVSRHAKALKFVDRGAIVLVVYSAFSEGVRDGIWQLVKWPAVLTLIALSAALVALLLMATWQVATWLGFSREDRIAVQFCGTKKSLASGLPMAAVLFSGQSVGMIVLPLMIFHQVQLMICSWLAARYARAQVS